MSTAMAMELKMMIKNEDQYVLCKVCNKAFSSGKAVGGHMRVHNPEMQGRKELARPRHKSSNGGFHADDTTCKLCGKVLPSMKSLFGHMRCHPERNWRGMNPPSAVVLPPSKKDVSWADIKNWPVTARRGRHVCGGQIKVEEADDDLFSAAVEGLLMLARGGVDDNEEKDKYSAGHELSDMSQSDDESEKKMISCSSKKKVVTKKMKFKTLEAVTGGKSYRCSTCNKSFPTSQALDGHMRAGHKKFKSYRGDDEEGGDKEDGGEEAGATGRHVLNFDLNELPHMEDGGAVDIAFHDA